MWCILSALLFALLSSIPVEPPVKYTMICSLRTNPYEDNVKCIKTKGDTLNTLSTLADKTGCIHSASGNTFVFNCDGRL